MITSDFLILAILAFNIAFCEWLVSKSIFKYFGTALLVILVTAIQANVGLIPSSGNAPLLYDIIFKYIAKY